MHPKYKSPVGAYLPIGPSIAYIPLSCGLFALIDRDDAFSLAAFSWIGRRKKITSNVYAYRWTTINGKRVTEMMHHAVLGNRIDGMVADHITGMTLVNMRWNLRHATHAQNMRNRKTPNNNTSGYKGVYFNKNENKWQAQIMTDGKRKSLGYYRTAKEAGDVYKVAARQYHGEFAREK